MAVLGTLQVGETTASKLFSLGHTIKIGSRTTKFSENASH